MSDDHAGLDLREQIARIDRTITESDKFHAEQRKLIAESLKLDRERWWLPWSQLITMVAAIVAAIGVLLRH